MGFYNPTQRPVPVRLVVMMRLWYVCQYKQCSWKIDSLKYDRVHSLDHISTAQNMKGNHRRNVLVFSIIFYYINQLTKSKHQNELLIFIHLCLKFFILFILLLFIQTGPVRLFVPYKRRKRDSIGSVSMLPTSVKKPRLNSTSGNSNSVNTSPVSSVSSTGQSPSKDSKCVQLFRNQM